MNHDDLTELQQDLDNAKHVVFLTGAGVSTHSGTPIIAQKTESTTAYRKVLRRF